jgi:hypothetical protein
MVNSDKPPRPADRGPLPVDQDPWTGQPAGDWQPVAEDAPGSSNSRQWQRIGILYNQLGITERETRLSDIQDRIPDRKITSTKDLSYVEAQDAIKELEELAKQETVK